MRPPWRCSTESLDKAVAAYRSALQVYAEEEYSDQRAKVQAQLDEAKKVRQRV
jgi:hypothetical protein